jgi:hypothetical protein
MPIWRSTINSMQPGGSLENLSESKNMFAEFDPVDL